MSAAARLLELYQGREDVFAEFSPGAGHYVPVHRPLTLADLEEHVAGTRAIGVYPIRLDDTVMFGSADVDDEQDLEKARREAEQVRAQLLMMGLSIEETLLSFSGSKGYHVDVFVNRPIAPGIMRRLIGVAAYRAGVTCEVFPKQDSRLSGEKQIGNLIKLPLAIHPKRRQLACILDSHVVKPADAGLVHGIVARLGDAEVASAVKSIELPDPSDPGRRYGPGQREPRITQLARGLNRHGIKADKILEYALEENRERFDPPHPEQYIRDTVADRLKRFSKDRHTATDAALAIRDGEDWALAQASTEGEPVGSPSGQGPTSDMPTVGESWRPVDVAALLAGGIEFPRPTVLERTDGVRLLYDGKEHAFIGPSESLKSMTTQIAASQVLAAGGSVVYADFETAAAYVVGNLVALGAPVEALGDRTRFLYVQPTESTEAGLKTLLAAMGDGAWGLTIIDGVDAAMSQDGKDPNVRKDFAQWRSAFVLPLKRRTAGPLVTIDHPTKAAGANGDAAGAWNKKGLADVQINFEVVKPFGVGTTGMAKLQVNKDRPGGLRQHAEGKQLAVLEITSTGEGERLTYELRPPEKRSTDGEFRPTNLMEKASRFLEEAAEPASQRAVLDGVEGKAEYVRKALARLVTEGYAAQTRGKGNAQLHTSIKPFRESASLRPECVPSASRTHVSGMDRVRPRVPSLGGTRDALTSTLTTASEEGGECVPSCPRCGGPVIEHPSGLWCDACVAFTTPAPAAQTRAW